MTLGAGTLAIGNESLNFNLLVETGRMFRIGPTQSEELFWERGAGLESSELTMWVLFERIPGFS